MNCKDFREIADSYLSNELLTETNHEMLQHLEHCANCRRELGARRELRDVLRDGVKNDSRSQINPIFAKNLTNNLREGVFGKQKSRSFASAKTIWASAFAVLILTVGFGLVWQKRSNQTVNLTPNKTNNTNINAPNEFSNIQQVKFIEARKDAIDDHKNCALTHNLEENPISLEKAAKLYGAENKNLDSTVIESLQKVFGDKVKLIEGHFCVINGRKFAHVIIEFQKKTVSVLMTKRENGEKGNDSDAISCQSSNDFQIACFESGSFRLFVISDLPETENLLIARTISPALKKHISENVSKV